MPTAPIGILSGSTAAGAATYLDLDGAASPASTGTAALPATEAFRPRPLSANGSDRRAAPGPAFTLLTKTPVTPARVPQLRQGKPDQDPPAKVRLNRLSLLSLLAGVVIAVLMLVTTAVPALLPWMVPLWLLLGTAAVVLGIRGANTLKAKGEKGSFLSFIGILLGGIGLFIGLVAGVILLLADALE
ncbi:MAG: hypothetical protein ICV83_20845 [Cytophagales bacterium]|nr:hypothetical protein [Cytophagales bacterium]